MYRKIMTVLGLSLFDTSMFLLACYGLATTHYTDDYAALVMGLWAGLLYRAMKELVRYSVSYDMVVRREK